MTYTEITILEMLGDIRNELSDVKAMLRKLGDKLINY
jgi:hypothetical protein